MQTLTCGYRICRSLHSVALPSRLQLLTLPQFFSSGEGVMSSRNLQTLTSGCRLNQSPHDYDADVGPRFDQSLHGVTLLPR